MVPAAVTTGQRIRHEKDERRSRVASGIVEFQIASPVVFVVDTPCRSSPIYEHEVFGEKEKVAYNERARERKGKFTCNKKKRYGSAERAGPGMDPNFPEELIFFSSSS